MPTAIPQGLTVLEQTPRLLSLVKRNDLRIVAQRLIESEGRLSIAKLHRLAKTRIPGTLDRYAVTVAYLVNRNMLRFNHTNKR
jgi:hypothetical protein